MIVRSSYPSLLRTIRWRAAVLPEPAGAVAGRHEERHLVRPEVVGFQGVEHAPGRDVRGQAFAPPGVLPAELELLRGDLREHQGFVPVLLEGGRKHGDHAGVHRNEKDSLVVEVPGGVLDIEEVLLLRGLLVLCHQVCECLEPGAVAGVSAVFVQFQGERGLAAHDLVHIGEEEGVGAAREIRQIEKEEVLSFSHEPGRGEDALSVVPEHVLEEGVQISPR